MSPVGKLEILFQLMEPSEEGGEPILTPEEAFKLLFGGEEIELLKPEEDREKFGNEEE